MKILFQFPQWRFKSLVLSYDDGTDNDRRLVDMFNKYGLRGTFHLCSGLFGKKGFVAPDEVKDLYQGHEVSCHTATHPSLSYYPMMDAMRETWDNRRQLEQLCEYPVQSMSYPCGAVNDEVTELLKNAGITSCRTTVATNDYILPEDFLRWHPSCHHSKALDLLDGFLNHRHHIMRCFMVWGHSYEFNKTDGQTDGWTKMEEFCAKVSGKEDVWYASMTDIVRYVTATRQAVSSADGLAWYNPSAETLYFTVDDERMLIKPGETLRIPR